MAEAITKIKYPDKFNAYSAGTHPKEAINPGALKFIHTHYNFEMSNEQYPKLLNSLPEIDVVVTMGCNVDCPFIPAKHREDWGLDDPSGKAYEAYLKTANIIEEKLEQLIHTMNTKYNF